MLVTFIKLFIAVAKFDVLFHHKQLTVFSVKSESINKIGITNDKSIKKGVGVKFELLFCLSFKVYQCFAHSVITHCTEWNERKDGNSLQFSQRKPRMN